MTFNFPIIDANMAPFITASVLFPVEKIFAVYEVVGKTGVAALGALILYTVITRDPIPAISIAVIGLAVKGYKNSDYLVKKLSKCIFSK